MRVCRFRPSHPTTFFLIFFFLFWDRMPTKPMHKPRKSHPQLSPCHVQVACQIWCHDEKYTCDTYQALHAPHNISVQEAHLLFTIKFNLATYMCNKRNWVVQSTKIDRKPIQRGALFSRSRNTHDWSTNLHECTICSNQIILLPYFCLSSMYYNCHKRRDVHCRLS